MALSSHPSLNKVILLDVFERLFIASMFGTFALRTLTSHTRSIDIMTILLLVSEGLPFLFILLRKPSTSLSVNPSDWLYGLAGSTLPLLVMPAITSPLISWSVCIAIIVFGTFTQISAKATLGLSFGVVAANRGVKSFGPYRVVRHPMYAGYTITHVGLLLAMPSLTNAILYAMALALQVIRIEREERVLMQDQAYRDFAARVRYRLFPGVY